MPGKHISKGQVKLYMDARRQGDSQRISSAKAGISERSGRKIERGPLPSKPSRHWRTRVDAFAPVWESELVPMLESAPQLSALTLLEYLQERYPDDYQDSQLRTLRRRVRQWRSLHGPAQEVMFRQEHEPGRQGLSDFTTLKDVQITLAGEVFEHILYHYRLAYSDWSYLKVIQGGESFTALSEGLQEALWRSGGSPKEHRTDS